MITTVFGSIITKLATDATILSYLGGAYVFRARAIAPSQIPSITVFTNNEKSAHQPGYNASKKRDNTPTVQIDIWVSSADEAFPCTGEDADLIENRLDELLLDASTPVTGTGSWEKTTSSQQHEEDTRIWHNAARYSFLYTVQDT